MSGDLQLSNAARLTYQRMAHVKLRSRQLDQDLKDMVERTIEVGWIVSTEFPGELGEPGLRLVLLAAFFMNVSTKADIACAFMLKDIYAEIASIIFTFRHHCQVANLDTARLEARMDDARNRLNMILVDQGGLPYTCIYHKIQDFSPQTQSEKSTRNWNLYRHGLFASFYDQTRNDPLDPTTMAMNGAFVKNTQLRSPYERHLDMLVHALMNGDPESGRPGLPIELILLIVRDHRVVLSRDWHGPCDVMTPRHPSIEVSKRKRLLTCVAPLQGQRASLRIRTVSRDQGYLDFFNKHAGSWSWFEVGVRKSSNLFSSRSARNWVCHHNSPGHRTLSVHDVVVPPEHVLWSTIRGGDKLVLTACVKFSVWANLIHEAEMIVLIPYVPDLSWIASDAETS
ncbi:hypothetical protein HGRIS_012362 [Hohenbuehelia grisea]|uniref:Uncharacterized protein n=1 Tax=Hohenbuehelia grisea TaxID=104357 RepID=A0ABR3IS05_9AGAR